MTIKASRDAAAYVEVCLDYASHGAGVEAPSTGRPMGSFEITCKKLAITVRDSREFYAHTETGPSLIGIEHC